MRYLAVDYLTILAVFAVAAIFLEYRAYWGLPRWTIIILFGLGSLIMGGVQHRLAAIAHEASHYTLLKNRIWNDLVGDWLCLFPLMSSVQLYRLNHMAHHQFVNDPDKDPDIINLGRSKKLHLFPMSRSQFIREALLRPILSPMTFSKYQWDYIYINLLGKGGNVYMKANPKGDGFSKWPRLGTSLGILLVLAESLTMNRLLANHLQSFIPVVALASLLAAAVGAAVLPDWAVYQSPFKEPYNSRVGGWFRIAFYTFGLVALTYLNSITGYLASLYFLLLWITPISTTFPYYMLLRDMYQHSNADAGRITNTRVFYTDWLTDWAVFVNGQDEHTPHHLFPSVPYYHLDSLHEWLKENDPEYALNVIEVHGTFQNHNGKPTIIDELTRRP
jgi:fatty acid desaturase